MGAGIVQKICLDHFDAYRKRHSLSKRALWAAWNMMTCRTPAQGYHVDVCPHGDYQVVVNNSCKHRSCPHCGATETELWLERRRDQSLSCRYFHVVFTISHELHGLWRKQRKPFTDLLFHAAWHSLRELLGDPKWLGAMPGAIGVFQSWDDEMLEHCHLHFIVTAGGMTPEGVWKSVNGKILIPTPVLAAKFRGKLLHYLREGFNKLSPCGKIKPGDQKLQAPNGMSVQQCLNLFNKLGRVKWHADIEPAYEHANGMYKYVGRYLRRGPISEKRIVGYDGQNVDIAYAHPTKHKERTFSLTAETFIQRMLSHVPEKGTHVVRAYGLFHPNCYIKLNEARAQLGQPPYEWETAPPSAQELLQRMFPKWEGNLCPRCGAILQTVYMCRGRDVLPLRMAA